MLLKLIQKYVAKVLDFYKSISVFLTFFFSLQKEKRCLEKDLKNAKATETVTAINNELREVKGELETLRNNYESLEEKDQRSLKRLRETESALAKEKDNHSSEMQSFSVSRSELFCMFLTFPFCVIGELDRLKYSHR